MIRVCAHAWSNDDTPQLLENGSLDFNLISLFPPTFKGRKNGMRSDIAEALEQLHPVSRTRRYSVAEPITNFRNEDTFPYTRRQ